MTTPNLTSLFGNAVATGQTSAAAAKIVLAPDLGAQIQAGLGVSVDDIQASEVFLVMVLIDDSGSIRFISGNTEAVRAGHNGLLQALRDSKQGDGILVSCRYLNGTILYPFVPLDQAIEMTSSNYDPNGGTPLYDQSIVALATVLAKATEFADNGVPVRSATCIVTDGNDLHSRQPVTAVRTVVHDMLMRETHIVAGMGVDDGGTDFRTIFGAMGVEDRWILTPQNSPSEIRKAFDVFSKSAVRASQSAGSFSQTALAGFGTP